MMQRKLAGMRWMFSALLALALALVPPGVEAGATTRVHYVTVAVKAGVVPVRRAARVSCAVRPVRGVVTCRRVAPAVRYVARFR